MVVVVVVLVVVVVVVSTVAVPNMLLSVVAVCSIPNVHIPDRHSASASSSEERVPVLGWTDAAANMASNSSSISHLVPNLVTTATSTCIPAVALVVVLGSLGTLARRAASLISFFLVSSCMKV